MDRARIGGWAGRAARAPARRPVRGRRAGPGRRPTARRLPLRCPPAIRGWMRPAAGDHRRCPDGGARPGGGPATPAATGWLGPDAMGSGLPGGASAHRSATPRAVRRGRCDRPSSGAAGRRRRYTAAHSRGPLAGRTGRDGAGRPRSDRGQRPGHGHRWRGPCRDPGGWRSDGRRHRRRPGLRRPARTRCPGGGHPASARGGGRGAATRHPGDAWHLPAPQPHHQWLERRDRGHRGARWQRRAHHRAACAGTGPRGVRGSRTAVGPRHWPAVWLCCARPRPARSWAWRSCSSTSASRVPPVAGCIRTRREAPVPDGRCTLETPWPCWEPSSGRWPGCCSMARRRPTRWSPEPGTRQRSWRVPSPCSSCVAGSCHLVRSRSPPGRCCGCRSRSPHAGPTATLHECTAP